MKKIIIVMMVSLLALLSGCAWYYEDVLDKSREIVEQNQAIRVPVIPDDVPMMYKNQNGEYEGLEVDIANAIAAKLGVKVQWIEAPTNKWEELLVNQEVDMIFAINDEDNHLIDQYYVSQPYFEEKTALAVKKESQINNFNGINNLKIGVSEGAKLVGLEAEYAIAETVIYPTIANALLGLINDEVDGVLATNSVLGTYYKDNAFEITIVEDKAIASYLVVCLEDNKLGQDIMSAMNQYQGNGMLDSLYEKWFTLN